MKNIHTYWNDVKIAPEGAIIQNIYPSKLIS